MSSSYTVIDRRGKTPPNRGMSSIGEPVALFTGPSSFDGAGSSPMRSLPTVSINSFWEITLPQLRAMQLSSRSLRNNLPIFRNIVKTTREFSIGWGLIPMPKSGDKDFDSRAKSYFMRWARNKKICDIRGQQDHCSQQSTACEDTFVDGEIFRAEISDALGRPTRKFYKTEQCGGMFGTSTMAPDGWWNGIRYDDNNTPLGYEFRQSYKGGSPFISDASDLYGPDQVQHIGDIERTMQLRMLPWAYAGLTTATDAMDMHALHQAKGKMSAAIFGNIETPTGGIPLSMQQLIQSSNQPLSALSFNTFADFPSPGVVGNTYIDKSTGKNYTWSGSGYVIPDPKDKPAVTYLNIHGTQIPLFRTGEKIMPFTGADGTNARDDIEFMFTGLAAAFGAPVNLFWNLAMNGAGGASVRGVFELGKRFFERVQRMMINTMCQPDYENVVATGILAYLYPADYPGVEPLAPPRGMDGWDCVTWRGPSDLTVDRGRDGRMYLELIRSGLMSREEWWVKNNEDPEEMEAVATDELAARLNHWVNVQGLPEDKFWLREFGANGSLSVTDDATPNPNQIAGHSIDELAAAVAQLIKEKPDRL